MNFSKAAFGDSFLFSFSMLSSESLKANIPFGTNGVNLSERCYFLLLISSFGSVNGSTFSVTSKISSFDIWQEIDVRYEFDLKVVLKSPGYKHIFAAAFDWIFKQQSNLLLCLSDVFCGKLGLTNLPGHDGKVTSDKKIIFISLQRYKVGNRDFWSYFLVTFEATSKFLIVFVRLILERKWVDVVIRLQREIEIRILGAVFDWIFK